MNRKLDKMKASASLIFMSRAQEMAKTDSSVIGLAGGEPDFTTPDRITVAAMRALTAGDTHYAVGQGRMELRQAIAKKLREENGIICDEKYIMVTPGGKMAVYLAVSGVLNEGDEAIILNPAWVSYEPMVIAAGGVPVNALLDYRNDYRITEEILEASCTEKTRLLIINYPNNPTGRILHEDEADILEAFMLRHPEIYLLSDEIYEKIIYDGKQSVSMGARPAIADRVMTVNGFSKSAAMTGWRLGYMAGSEESFKAAYKIYQHSVSNVSGFLQAGALEALKCHAEIEEMRVIYEQRRDMFTGILNSIPGVKCSVPEGAFYAWVFFDVKGMDSTQICEYLLENAKVVGVPGSSYGETNVACIRFSFANATHELEEAANRIKKVITGLNC